MLLVPALAEAEPGAPYDTDELDSVVANLDGCAGLLITAGLAIDFGRSARGIAPMSEGILAAVLELAMDGAGLSVTIPEAGCVKATAFISSSVVGS